MPSPTKSLLDNAWFDDALRGLIGVPDDVIIRSHSNATATQVRALQKGKNEEMLKMLKMLQEHQTIAALHADKPSYDLNTSSHSLVGMIGMRLRIPENYVSGFDALHAHQVSPDKVIVFVIANGQPVTIEDDGGLFPSDALITQLRILRG